MSIDGCKIIDIKTYIDGRGKLSFLDIKEFDAKRIFYIYDTKFNDKHGEHAHKNCKQLLIVLSGEITIFLDDGNNSKIYEGFGPNEALYIPPLIWTEIYNFSSGAICLVATSELYNEEDYIRDYSKFLKEVK